ncbi:putative LTR transposon [Pseudoloma neurophilia]|uniref:Putative LTR transposon n=1 Tax=Pseudoloma neurophilia TaxID=146866 RepID=A0A0R0M1W0_9MICR|nr:putative LTR transposon [Pseudoloma neurophilia]
MKIYHILSIIDRHSRYVELIPLKDIQSKTICEVIENNWFNTKCLPQDILTDQGTQFMSQEFKNLLAKWKVEHRISTAYNPQGNSIAERMMQEITKGLRILRETPLKSAVKKIVYAHNNIYHRMIGCSPLRALNINETKESPKNLHLREQINQRITKIYGDSVTIDQKEFAISDRVWLKNQARKNKLDPTWSGPYTIT